ncbi:hypothetical protein [Sapientia aquatica]|uniref:Uncharacterized protein n=1 Tax=Sapientia aquatica TaxID=1549640 RepID=A0A4R5W1U9_9BURK|nr:hypothetical protein [Sapientia aquatica]TDK66401.1 hypothetical protein E2I14_07965 [Sapientia aquatica]
MMANLELNIKEGKMPIVFPQIAIVCGVIQALIFSIAYSKLGLTIWLPIINLLGIVACIADLFFLHYFKNYSPDFNTFRFVFILDLLNGLFLTAAISLVPQFFTSNKTGWIYTEHQFFWVVLGLILIFYSLLREAKSNVKKMQLTKAQLLFSGEGLAGIDMKKSQSVAPVLIISMVIALNFLVSQSLGRYDIFLFAIFAGSLFVTAQIFASFFAATYQLFLKFEKN